MAKTRKVLISGMGLMVKEITLLGLSALFVSHIAFTDNSSNQISVASNDITEYSARKGTFKNIKGESSILMMFDNKSDKTIKHYKISIKNTDCDNGSGKLSFFSMDGRLDFQGDYVVDGNGAGAGMGDFVCAMRVAAANTQKDQLIGGVDFHRLSVDLFSDSPSWSGSLQVYLKRYRFSEPVHLKNDSLSHARQTDIAESS